MAAAERLYSRTQMEMVILSCLILWVRPGRFTNAISIASVQRADQVQVHHRAPTRIRNSHSRLLDKTKHTRRLHGGCVKTAAEYRRRRSSVCLLKVVIHKWCLSWDMCSRWSNVGRIDSLRRAAEWLSKPPEECLAAGYHRLQSLTAISVRTPHLSI